MGVPAGGEVVPVPTGGADRAYGKALYLLLISAVNLNCFKKIKS